MLCVREMTQGTDHQAMIYVVKEPFDVHVYDPCIFPTVLSGLLDG